MIETGIYRNRFSSEELAAQRTFWRPICAYLQKHVEPDGVTLDLGAGFCHFINQIRSRRKIAVDINGEVLSRYADPSVERLISEGANLSAIPRDSVDTVFASNVYEHLSSREDVASSFREVYRILRPGGRFVILQPNFAYCYRSYFDFFDHRLIFTHRGMCEGLSIAEFQISEVVPRFLPYTSKSRLPKAPWLVSLYLRFPAAWRLLGGQMLIVARKGTGGK
ncbi:MAG: class I SAM-dependent methyltransferase [Bryobacteraceae bacterium]